MAHKKLPFGRTRRRGLALILLNSCAIRKTPTSLSISVSASGLNVAPAPTIMKDQIQYTNRRTCIGQVQESGRIDDEGPSSSIVSNSQSCFPHPYPSLTFVVQCKYLPAASRCTIPERYI
ncbi:hypothetical protein PT974_08591 [Cladobotryum mycophilum]|uniref:Uncharacterized protein n=1 Tax=Cladobotryum mycophilum TaxID=491253 RepID=A0ABR0SDW1_9HYPO